MPKIRLIYASVYEKTETDGRTDGWTDRRTECKPIVPLGFAGRGLKSNLEFNATLTAEVISRRSVTHVFSGLLTPVGTEFSFQNHRLLLVHAAAEASVQSSTCLTLQALNDGQGFSLVHYHPSYRSLVARSTDPSIAQRH